MKVLLINPTFREINYSPPLGLGYIGAYLEQGGHEVRLLDREVCYYKNQSMDLVDRESSSLFQAIQPDLIGITSMTPTIPDAFHVAALAKHLLPKVPVVLGGVHASILPQETLEASPDIDIVVRGEGELTLKELCDGAELGTVAGIVYRRNGDLIATPARGVIPDLDVLPLPARHLFDMKAYLNCGPELVLGIEARSTNLFTSRGCPYRCTYCAGSCVFGPKVRFASPPRVVEEIERILSDYPVEGFLFCDDSFASSRKRALEICRLFIEHRIHHRIVWVAQLHVNQSDEELLRLMKRAGCVQVAYGFESGSQRILDIMDKRTTVRQNYEAAALTRKAGLLFLANIIVGTPGETREDFMATIEFLRATRPDWIAFHKFIPLPGSKLFDDLKRKKLIDSDWSKYHVGLSNNQEVNFTAMPTREFNERFEYYHRHLVKPACDRAYVRYNLPRKPIRTLRNIPSLIAAYQSVPSVVRDLIRSPVRTLAAVAGRVAADPGLILRKIREFSNLRLG